MLKKEFTLRPYQDAFIRDLGIAVKQHRRVIGCAATGAGKSKTFLRIAVNAIRKGYTVLVITESRKIFKQLIAEVHAFEIKPGEKPPIVQKKIYLAMAQTLRRRKALLEQFHGLSKDVTPVHAGLLIINDECHINEATKILTYLSEALLIGFSGSPVGKHLVKLYNHLVVGPQPHELVLDGFLSPYKHFERKRADISQLEMDRIGEYTEESQERTFGTRQVYDGLIEDLNTVPYKKGLIYTSSIKHCEATAEELRAAGFKCVVVHSGLKGKEEYNLFQFTHGLVPLCVSVGILTKGFDYPPIDLIVLLRKTTSLALYLQMIGRGSRVLEGEEFLPISQRIKQFFTVLDYGQNCEGKGGHLPWDWKRDWATIWRGKPKRPGVSPIKVCPRCEYINAASAKVCVNCGYVWMSINTEEEPESPETILIEITAKYNKLVGRKLSDLTPHELSIYAKSKGTKNHAIRVAKWHARKEGHEWLREFARHMNYKPQWVHITLQAMEAVIKSNPQETFEFNDLTLR